MTFKRLSEYFSQLESTTLRNKMVEILASLFKEAKVEDIGKLAYLLQGRVAPLFEAVEFGLADKMMIRAIAIGLQTTTEKVTAKFKKEGDLGKAVQQIKNQKSIRQLADKNTYKKLKITDVYDVLYKIASSGGTGSQELKINLLGDLLREVDPLSAKYIVKITLAKLRLGFSDMTMLDALSWMISGTKEHRNVIEKAYNVRPDFGFICSTIKKKGIKGLSIVIPIVGTPILMARAERMSNAKDIIEKIGKCAVEPKYDGFRVQVHFSKKINPPAGGQNLKLLEDGEEQVKLFSRNLEDVTLMYPDIVEGVVKQIAAKEAIFEGEAIAYNPKTGAYLPFQETVQRKRKYGIEAKAKEIPLKLFAFDLLYVDSESLLLVPYRQRRARLTQLINKGETIAPAQVDEIEDPKKLELIFTDCVTRGLEGVMAKKLEGVYRAGARDFNWIKYKRSYASKLSDTIDCVVMGIDFGQGKRTGFGIGDFLIGVYDAKREMFVTVAKIGTGLTDDEWKALKVTSDKLHVTTMPKNYDVDKAMFCDVWMSPKIVVEIRADEITRSPVHTAGRILGPSKSGSAKEVKTPGFALRFPRLERFRDDKKPEDATTLKEVSEMFLKQGKK